MGGAFALEESLMSARLAPTARRFGIAEVFAAKVGVSYATFHKWLF
jgi:hypothetical protein